MLRCEHAWSTYSQSVQTLMFQSHGKVCVAGLWQFRETLKTTDNFILAHNDSQLLIWQTSECLNSCLYCCNYEPRTNKLHVLEDSSEGFFSSWLCLQCFATFQEVGDSECGSSWDKTICRETLCVSVCAHTCRQDNKNGQRFLFLLRAFVQIIIMKKSFTLFSWIRIKVVWYDDIPLMWMNSSQLVIQSIKNYLSPLLTSLYPYHAISCHYI